MWLDHLRIAVVVLRAFKFRSCLTVGSILIGAFSIVLMSSLAGAGLRTLVAGLEEIGGSRLLALWARTPVDPRVHRLSYTAGLTREDLRRVRLLPHVRGSTLLADLPRADVAADTGQALQADVVGVDEDFFAFFGYHAAAGRVLDAADLRDHRPVCVVGHDTAAHLQEGGGAALGQMITLRGVRCQIVGELAPVQRFGVRFGWDWDDFVAAPITVLADHARVEIDRSRWLVLQSDDQQHNQDILRTANALLLSWHHEVSDFQLLDFNKGFVEQTMKVFLIMQLIVGLLSGIALIVGGVGVMNIMLVSVSQRVREIGIRKALGASPADIRRQFLVESALLSGAGGLLGVLLGLLGSVAGGLIIRHFQPGWIIAVSWPAALLAGLLSVFIGVVFGLYPAWSASRLPAVAAIRLGSV